MIGFSFEFYVANKTRSNDERKRVYSSRVLLADRRGDLPLRFPRGENGCLPVEVEGGGLTSPSATASKHLAIITHKNGYLVAEFLN